MSKKINIKWDPKTQRYINTKTNRFIKTVKGGKGKRK